MFSDDLARYGPGTKFPPLSPAESRRYCRRLARRHYENFAVLSLFLPRRLRQHVANVYAYCRWADDLADEIGDLQRSLELLDWWEAQIGDCYQGRAAHPVFTALSETIQKFHIPAEPFRDLLVAFRQDQRQTRYETAEDLLEYCRHSANPVGRLVLSLGECRDAEMDRLSDAICSGLQNLDVVIKNIFGHHYFGRGRLAVDGLGLSLHRRDLVHGWLVAMGNLVDTIAKRDHGPV